MWFDSREDETASLEATIAMQLCEDPMQVYVDEHPGVLIEDFEDKDEELDQDEVKIEFEDEEKEKDIECEVDTVITDCDADNASELS